MKQPFRNNQIFLDQSQLSIFFSACQQFFLKIIPGFSYEVVQKKVEFVIIEHTDRAKEYGALTNLPASAAQADL